MVPMDCTMLIIHRRLLVEKGILDPNAISNFCFECTAHGKGGKPIQGHERRPYKAAAITSFVGGKKTKVVVNQGSFAHRSRTNEGSLIFRFSK